MIKHDYLTSTDENHLTPFFSPKMLKLYLDCIWSFGLLLLLFWPKKALHDYIYHCSSPICFSAGFVAALIIISYVSLCCGRGEMVHTDYVRSMERKEVVFIEETHDFFTYGFVEFFLHTILLILILFPMLIWASGVSGISLYIFAKAVLVLFLTSLVCRMFGFLMYLMFGKWSKIGYISARIFFIFFIFLTGIFAPVANPIRLIHALWAKEKMITWSLTGTYSIFSLLSACIILSLILTINVILRRRNQDGNLS
ncbi:MAG: hypothetical protein GY795_32920 [Desulfobacterales bacterium]|nr:hypothetical protein [Desulfobacterales bacterium]